VSDADGLARAVSTLLGDPHLRSERAAAARRVAEAGSDILDMVLMRLAPWLDRLAPVEDAAGPPVLLRA
jgi:hypothetical protein